MDTEKRRMGQSAVVIADPGTLVDQYAQPIPARTNRAEGDYRPDTEVKGEWLASCPEGERPVLVFDDRTKTVAWWREQGIMCAQVAQHDY